jgi:circadian clock protein KaiC
VRKEDASTGISGLDDVLSGGLTPGRLYLLEGVPGSGKTTLAMQCLIAGAAAGERVLYITLSETAEELRLAAQSHGWSHEGIDIFEMSTPVDLLDPEQQYTVFHASEIELGASMEAIRGVVEKIKPTRVVIDSLSELRMVAGTALRYRRQIVAFKSYFTSRGCTAILLDDLTSSEEDLQVQSIAHGVIRLEMLQSEYGVDRRRLRVLKCRARAFRGGYHDYVIRKGGIVVFPRLIASEHKKGRKLDRLSSGNRQMDDLLGGGLERGSATLLVGAAGSGKSSIAAQFVANAAAAGDKGAMFIFDEVEDMLLTRSDALSIDLRKHCEAGTVNIHQVDPAEMSPGELTWLIRKELERGAKIVVIDSLNGYLNAMPEERFLIVQLHELLTYMNQQGVVTILVSAQQGLIGPNMRSVVDASYLADAVLLLRYFEWRGTVRQALSVVKKRGGQHERSIRELNLQNGRIDVGEPLKHFRGILTGVPIYDSSELEVFE